MSFGLSKRRTESGQQQIVLRRLSPRPDLHVRHPDRAVANVHGVVALAGVKLSRPVPCGAIRLVLTRRPTWPLPGASVVSNVTTCGRRDWLETTRFTGPAPTAAGDTWTNPSCTAAVSVTGGGWAVDVARGSPLPPHAAIPAEPARTSATATPARIVAKVAQQRLQYVRFGADAGGSVLELPLATAEFLAVDTETNGLPGDRCELTEVGAVLVGGGELHDEFQSLVGVASPLGRGIQRFTGISQAMVDAAPPPEQILPHFAAQLRGRVLVAHNARFDTRVLQQAFARAALDWPDPPVVCTVALARRFAPLQRRRGLSALAAALGIEVDTVHRALPDARTCARVFCALFGRLCAHAPTVGEALALLHPAQGAPGPAAGGPAAPGRAPAPRRAPARARRLRVPRRRRARALRGQVDRPAHARAGALHLRGGLDGPGRARGPPADGVGARSAAAGGPAHQVAAPAGQHARQGGAGRLRLPALPAGHPVPHPRGGARARPGHAVCVGPLQGRAATVELMEQLNSLFGLRHCGRTLPRREHPSVYGQMGRCLSPCLRDLDPNVYRERLDAALGLFSDDGEARC